MIAGKVGCHKNDVDKFVQRKARLREFILWLKEQARDALSLNNLIQEIVYIVKGFKLDKQKYINLD